MASKILGETVKFRVYGKIDGKEYGTVFLNGKDIALDLVSSGLAQVNSSHKFSVKTPLNRLKSAEAAAKEAHEGMHAEDTQDVAVRKVQRYTEALLSKLQNTTVDSNFQPQIHY